MRGYFFLILATAMFEPAVSSARSDEIPTLDVRPVCRGIASQAAEPLATGLPSSFEQCVKSEEEVREQLKREWPAFSAADKQHCVTLAKTGGESSNTELLTCLEMARDVRALRSAAAVPSGTDRAKQPASSPSMPTVQPAPAAKASQPPPAKESPAAQGDQMVREVERAKAEAQAAKDSEALTRRKLVEAEAALQRVKEEARLATAEAERAKTDAKAARESEGEAKRKLADAEAARVAAEGREQACHSAAKTPSGFRARFRSWFRPRQPDAKNP